MDFLLPLIYAYIFMGFVFMLFPLVFYHKRTKITGKWKQYAVVVFLAFLAWPIIMPYMADDELL